MRKISFRRCSVSVWRRLPFEKTQWWPGCEIATKNSENLETGLLSTGPKILLFISVNFQWWMEQHFADFPEKSTTSRGISKFPRFFYLECPFHLSFLPELLVEWFALSEIRQILDFLETFPERFLFSKFSEISNEPLPPPPGEKSTQRASNFVKT